ncbi:MAG: hypothetical protein ACI97A_003456 [Planctomycetota bacterium]|jgi:hypothetical protein
MATRAERVKEALEQVEGHEKVAYALAINEEPMRRQYFNDVCGFNESIIVKTLAKLANGGIVGDTDGLLFHVASKEIAKDVLELLPSELAQEIHDSSLAWSEGREDVSDRFVISHMIGAGEYAMAAEKVLLARHAEDDAFKIKGWLKHLRQIFTGLMTAKNIDIELCLEVGIQVVHDGLGLMRPKALTTILADLSQLKLNPDQNALVLQTEEWLKDERLRVRTAAKAQVDEESNETQESLVENTTQEASQ